MTAALPFMYMIPLAFLSVALRDALKYELLPWRNGKPGYQEKDGFETVVDLMDRSGLFGPMALALQAQQNLEHGGLAVTAVAGPIFSNMENLTQMGFGTWFMRQLPPLSVLPEERKQVAAFLSGG